MTTETTTKILRTVENRAKDGHHESRAILPMMRRRAANPEAERARRAAAVEAYRLRCERGE